MTNAEIAQVFERIALILDLKGNENPFRIRAYERAAMVIENLPTSLRDVYATGGVQALEELPGIGADLAKKIEEMLRTRKLRFLEELERKIPHGLLEILEIEGMGPKRTKILWQKFQVKSIEDLKKLAESGKLAKLRGWGEKSTQNILRGIEMRKKMGGRLPLAEATFLAQEIVEALRRTGLCEEIAIAGSLRRQRETVGDIDVLVTSNEPEKVIEAFCNLPEVDSILAKGTTKSTVFLKAGLDADLRVVESQIFGAALHYFTGSKDHNVHVRRIGVRKGLTISEYGVYRGTAKRKGKLLACQTEEEVYRTVGLPYIPPELREDRGEIEAALERRLPHLLSLEDLQSDLHLHSTYSDGASSMEEMAHAAKERGLRYIAITDHASPLGMVKGIKHHHLKDYLDRIEAARRNVRGIHILAGAEVDILEDGRLYLPDDALRELEWIVASVHQHFRQERATTTQRLIRALQNPFVHVLGHPTARLLGKREGIAFDLEQLLEEAKRQRKALELNTSPERLDLPDIALKRAKELGIKISLGSDAHSPSGLDVRFGIAQARRGWLEEGDMLNTLPWEEFHAWRQSHRS